MDEARRRAYLEAMGITVWVPRETGEAGHEAGQADAVAAADAAAAPASSTAAQAGAGGPAAVSGAGESGEGTVRQSGATEVAAMDAEALREAILGCTACSLCDTRTQAVPGVGSMAADLLVIGEAPGQEEDRRGEPFVGRAGQLLDRMLAAIGLDRQTVYITNVLKCRPPNNRDPRPEEVRACAGYLRRQIELIAPKAILSVGRISSQSLLETDQAIGRLRDTWHRYGPHDTPLRVTYHPAYLLRSPAQKRKSWADLKAVQALLRE